MFFSDVVVAVVVEMKPLANFQTKKIKLALTNIKYYTDFSRNAAYKTLEIF